MAADNNTAVAANNSVQNLKQYLLYVLSAESAVYFFSERYLNIKKAIIENENTLIHDVAKSVKDKENRDKANERAAKKEDKAKKALIIEIENKIKALEYEFNTHDFANDVEKITILAPQEVTYRTIVDVPAAPIPPTLKTPGIFNKKKILAENEELTKKYQQALEKYHIACKTIEINKQENERREKEYKSALVKYEESCKAENDRVIAETKKLKDKARKSLDSKIKRLEDKIAELNESSGVIENEADTVCVTENQNAAGIFLSKELVDAKNGLKNAAKVLNKLYSYNIVHPKYRNQVAIATFYEYLDVGRCTSLVGTDGAYNIYENECRSNLIIAQLNTVIEKLDEIKKNQYLIYKELTEINANLRSLNRSADKVINQIDKLQLSADEMTKYLNQISVYTKDTAQNTAEISIDTQKILHNTNLIQEDTVRIAHNTDIISQNTAITAHYSAVTAKYAKINAELTNSLGFMIALK